MEFTEKLLKAWSGETVFREALTLYERGAVLEASFEAPWLKGTLSFGNRPMQTRAKIAPDGTCESLCPCRDSSERGIVCVHVVATGMVLARRQAASVARREQQAKEEQVKAVRVAGVKEDAYLQRIVASDTSTQRARIALALAPGWDARRPVTMVPLRCSLAQGKALIPVDQVSSRSPVPLSKDDDALMYVLEDILEGPVPGTLSLRPVDFASVLKVRQGSTLQRPDGTEARIESTPLASRLHVDMEPATGCLRLCLHTDLPVGERGQPPLYVVAGRSGWVYAGGTFYPLARVLPAPFHTLYQETVQIPREAVLAFLQKELPLIEKELPVITDLSADLFVVEPAMPRFYLELRGSPASIAATLFVDYGGIRLVAARQTEAEGRFAHPDPDDFYRFTVRNPEAEKRGLARLAECGFSGVVGDDLTPLVGTRTVLNFLGRHWPALRRAGWKVEPQGSLAAFMEQADFISPVVHIQNRQADGFDVGFIFEDREGRRMEAAEIQRAIRMGDAFIEQDGSALLLDAGAIEAMQEVFDDCASGEGAEPGMFRLPSIYASYVKSSLDALDGVDVETEPAWMEAARRQNREVALERISPHPMLQATLRPYQQDGLSWLRFLERGGYAGVLADEMGLGKTLQTLAWLQLERTDEAARGHPALIVCPTSLVDNWAMEAARFTPDLRVVTIAGADRHSKWESAAEHDVVITSYALLRRDIERYAATQFSVAILDEAQHIKNRSTQNALAAKRLQAARRLVLTGTPIENGVADFWSIMDFLMPGYLGSHESFRRTYELPIMREEEGARFIQARLKRKLSPFLLRRLKRDVATDLPPKIERVAFCGLSPDQQKVYRKLLDDSRRRLTSLVNEQGFNRARMEVLTTLLRLRQACCHLDLLKQEKLVVEQPSAKLELFLELLNEAMDGGHRVLVFSQFVSMLQILRGELDRRETPYCYLDGSTQDRMAVVQRFNTDRTIPVFLISLKAGGTGLNLTGADMVIHYDPWWNPAVEAQATDRAYRIGQKRTVYSIKLITRGAIEEKVLAMQDRKRAVIDATLESDEQVMNKLSWEDVQELLEL